MDLPPRTTLRPEKQAILEQLIREQADEYGIDPAPIVDFTPIDGWGDYYPPRLTNANKGRIVLNDDLLDDPEMLVTASHEMRHAMQHKAVDDAYPSAWEKFWGDEPVYETGATEEEVREWKENDDEYVEPPTDKDFEEDPAAAEQQQKEYEEQAVEADAEADGRRSTSELTPEELERLKEAADG